MPNCLGCHTYNVLGRKVCKACGQALPVDEGSNCSHCGNEMGPFAKRCRACGWEKTSNEQYIPKEAPEYTRKNHDVDEDLSSVYYEEYLEINKKSGWLSGCLKWVIGIAISVFLILTILFIGIITLVNDDEEKDKEEISHEQDPYILENSATIYLKEQDLKGLDKKQLRFARNEIYARHGFVFGKGDLQEYFSKQSWYTPNDKFTESLLSELEHKNVSFIQQYEKQKGK